jgi:methyl-accepting chemotaxis protein
MQEIVESVKRVTDIMAEITAASQEQSSGIEQVNQAIAQMDQVTQQNAALVEEAAAAAESMQNQAASLMQTVSVFKLDRSHSLQVSAPQAPAPRNSNQSRPVAPAKHHAPLKAVSSPRKPVAATTGDDWEEF